ncbi:hypothetical protein JCM11641_001757 [Rhodosporidiobolus odoratus]
MAYKKYSSQIATLAGLRKVGGTSVAKLKDELLGFGSRSSYYRWAAQVKCSGTGHRPATEHLPRGRPRRLSREQADWLISLHSQHPSLSANTLAYHCLLTTGKYISSCAVYFYLHPAGMSYKRLERRAKEEKPEQEANFLFERTQYTPEQIVAIDETHIDPRSENSLYGWAKRGMRAIGRVLFRHSYSLSAVGVMSHEGLLGVPVIEGSYTAQRLIEDVLEAVVFPASNPYPLENSVILLENAPTHKNREVLQAIEDHRTFLSLVYLLSYINASFPLCTPPYSPWWQPCEFLFGALKNAL